MAADISPAASGDRPGEPAVRASHADRDRVVETLRVAAGEGLLGADELEERVGAALTARTRDELAPLTADLPATVAAAEAKDVVRIEQAHSGPVERTGRWVVPRRLELAIAWCAVRLDFTDAVLTHDTLEIDAQLTGKTLTLIAGPGVVVDTDDFRLAHCRLDDRRAPADPDAPVALRVRLSGAKAHGRVVLRSAPRRRWFGRGRPAGGR